jgi:hypothetical protein
MRAVTLICSIFLRASHCEAADAPKFCKALQEFSLKASTAERLTASAASMPRSFE